MINIYAIGTALFLAGLAMPARWGLRLVLLIVASFSFWVFVPEDNLHDVGAGYSLGLAVIAMALVAFAVFGFGAVLRSLWESWRHGGLTKAGGDAGFLAGFSALLWFILGVWCAFWVYWTLSWVLRGADAPGLVHLLGAGAVLGASVALLVWLKGSGWPVICGAMICLLALIAGSALLGPARMVKEAARLAGGAPRCWMLGAQQRPPENVAELMPMTMGKTQGGPSALILRVEQGDQLVSYRWSFRGRAFVRNYGDFSEGYCIPHRDPLLPVK